jgi:hypothetical protein
MVEIFKFPATLVRNEKTVVERQDIIDNHPVAIAHDIYVHSAQHQKLAPTIRQLLAAGNTRLADYLMFLAPRMCFGEPDCRIVLRGEKIPGDFDPESFSGRSYSEFLKSETDILPATVLVDVFFSLVTRHVLLAEARIPFKSCLQITTYRGIFPVWNDADKELWAALICAPNYVELDDKR